jgi:hypothetical protein
MSRAAPRATIRALPPAPSHRKPRAETALEGAAAEFALLAQRRARLRRQLDLLERQHTAAVSVMTQVETRMALLSRRMAGLTPDAPPDAPQVAPAPAPTAPQAATQRRRAPVLQY